MGEFIGEIVVGAAVSGLAGFAWLIRLEARCFQQSKDLERLEKELSTQKQKHDDLSKELMDKIVAMSNTLSRIEERLKMKES